MPWRHLLAVVCVGVSKDGPGGAEPGPRTDQGAQASPPPPALPASLAPPRGPGFPFQGGREPGQACTAVQPRPVSPRRPPDAPQDGTAPPWPAPSVWLCVVLSQEAGVRTPGFACCALKLDTAWQQPARQRLEPRGSPTSV